MDEIKRTADGATLEGRAAVEHDNQPNQGATQTGTGNEGKANGGTQPSDEA
jgi:hypothetical protein